MTQRLIEENLGATVAQVRPCGGGFTAGFAAVIQTVAGIQQFVKAAPKDRVPHAYQSYRTEAAMLQKLQPVFDGSRVSVPRLRWQVEAEGWCVLGFDAVDGVTPNRPWHEGQLQACLAALADLAESSVPKNISLDSLAGVPAEAEQLWGTYCSQHAQVPFADEVTDLLGVLPSAVQGDHMVHNDIRDDNLLISTGGGGQVHMVDWSCAARGPAWFDTLCLLISVHGDGHDTAVYFDTHPVFQGVPAGHVDAGLVALLSYFLAGQSEPDIPQSPHLRGHQRWYANATGSLLAARRGWLAGQFR